MEQIIQQLTVVQKKSIIKSNEALTELFKTNVEKALSKAKGEDIDSFITSLDEEHKNIFIEFAKLEHPPLEVRKTKKKKDDELHEDDEHRVEELEKDDKSLEEDKTIETIQEIKNIEEETIEEEPKEKKERELTDNILKKIFKDLYPTSIHKIKYIQDNPSLKMAALTKGILGKNVKKEDIDDFLVIQVTKNPKSLKQLTIDWIENKKSMKLDINKLSSESITCDEIKEMVKDSPLEDIETYCYLMQSDVSEKTFDFIETIKEEEIKKVAQSEGANPEKYKKLEERTKELERQVSDSDQRHKDEINGLRQNYEIEKEKLKAKYEQKLETLKNKTEDEKTQLVKIQADCDRRYSEERKGYTEKIESLEKELKYLGESFSSANSELGNQNKQNKDRTRELARIQNKIEELQVENKEVTAKNEEIKLKYETVYSDLEQFKKKEFLSQEKIQELSIKIQELEKIRIAFLLNETEIQNVIKELNAVDETKERMLQLLNIDTRRTNEQNNLSLDDLWVQLIEHEENIIADYLMVAAEEVENKDILQEKIDNLLDLEYNLKAREVLVKMLYEKGYKAYKENN